jgi:hypothetical protein
MVKLVMRNANAAASLILSLLFVFSVAGQNKGLTRSNAVLWRDPGNISRRDLKYGPGSAALAPKPPFTYIEEDEVGASPKIKVKDREGVEWVVKLGIESQSETVSNRLVWAMGYFAEEAYYLNRVEVSGLPKLSRGQEFVENQRVLRGARFEPRRINVKRRETWKWLKNPFAGTRELDGLKTLMVLLANYDTRPENNRVLEVSDSRNGRKEYQYAVTDIGATLGKIGGMGGKRTKNNLADYRANRFIKKVEDGFVEFDYRTRPKGLGYFTFVFSPGYWRSQSDKEKAMKRIPVAHARWMGSMLSQLSNDQLRDAFRAANYDPATTEGYITTIRSHINQLASLPTGTGRSLRVAGIRQGGR